MKGGDMANAILCIISGGHTTALPVISTCDNAAMLKRCLRKVVPDGWRAWAIRKRLDELKGGDR